MSDETTTEQLAEIDRDMADIERQVAELVEEAQQADYKTQELPEYTPPEGWRVVQIGEPLKGGDEYHAGLDRYIRRIEPQPQPQPESDTELQAQVAFLKGREVTLGTRLQQEREVTTKLRSEVSYVQNLLGTEKRRVAELEELVASLRTINETSEKAFTAAGKENTALRNQLTAVKAELASVAADRQRLQIELDAAQQVPADSPELRQLRADLADVTRERDQYLDSYQRIFGDLETIRETTKAAAVEAIVEWLVPIRTCGSCALATAVISNLPHIMRSLTGLEDEEIE